ncbi:helix-turn-helix domain-containing protein [Lysinibacter sp. HNR]|uniref:winged helix-turn-helix transcriptional regulator n=1 Tax=Lysinibacter sp. HNR TaxID=3031408 RepID=UPI002435C9EE|nr:helix-turn-helix domain-containing protein [Lysinibacter sp. HNR]WGD37612.1 helix-turn-helix domain-containing protein [Lysinibacter sp. HNR]
MRESIRHALSVCPVEVTVSVVGGAWKLTIVELLLDRTLRYGELRREVGDITDRVLTRQLRELEGDGLVRRTVFPEVPPRVEYALTPLGETLRPLINAMSHWGYSWAASQGVHVAESIPS